MKRNPTSPNFFAFDTLLTSTSESEVKSKLNNSEKAGLPVSVAMKADAASRIAPNDQKILGCLAEADSAMTLTQICEETGIDNKELSWRLKRLADRGILSRESPGNGGFFLYKLPGQEILKEGIKEVVASSALATSTSPNATRSQIKALKKSLQAQIKANERLQDEKIRLEQNLLKLEAANNSIIDQQNKLHKSIAKTLTRGGIDMPAILSERVAMLRRLRERRPALADEAILKMVEIDYQNALASVRERSVH